MTKEEFEKLSEREKQLVKNEYLRIKRMVENNYYKSLEVDDDELPNI